MSPWLRTLLGVEDQEIPADAVTSFEFANLPPPGVAMLLGLLLLGAILFGVFSIYKREGSASRRVKTTLAVLRCLALIAVAVVLLEPVLTIDRFETVEKKTLVIVDGSLSMSTKDRYRDSMDKAALRVALGVDPATESRAQLVDRALKQSKLIPQLTSRNPVEILAFAESLAPISSLPRTPLAGGIPAALAQDPMKVFKAARGSDLSGAVRTAIESVGPDRVAGIIVITDGRSNLGSPPEELPSYLRAKGIKLHTVRVGDDEPARNLRVASMAGPESVFRKDPLAIDAKVTGRGYPGATVVLEKRPAGTEEWDVVEEREVAFKNDGEVIDLSFRDRPQQVGAFEYRLRIPAEKDETTDRDNAKTIPVDVIKEQVKVLLVSGGPTFEYYSIKNVLLRDPTVKVACFLQSADSNFPQDGNNISLRSLPSSLKELVEFQAIILCDADGALMPSDWPALLKEFVAKHRGGIAFVAGNKHTLGLLRRQADLVDILPVVLDLDTADRPGIGIGFGRVFDKPWLMEPEPAAFIHPATRFHYNSRRAKDLVWRRLPPLYWYFPVLKAKPGATVLARHPRDQVTGEGLRPVLATHRYGSGVCLFLACDETYRWRSTAESIFDRFWVQTTRYLLEGRHAGNRKRFRVYLDREQADLGDSIHITAEVLDDKYAPLEDESVTVLIKTPGDKVVELVLPQTPNQPGTYNGAYAPAGVGIYKLEPAEAEFRGKQGAAVVAAFEIVLPDREMGDVRADKGLLTDLARRTSGLAVGLDGLEKLAAPQIIPTDTERIVTSGRPLPLWDTWTTIIVVLLLLCAEWILRKRHRMV